MRIRVAHHIFASIKGYETQFRSPDVSDLESGELESFSFGQTNDSNYMESLQEHPAFTVRKLRSGRWAITRVFAGADDEYGRATLLFHTVLIRQQEWARALNFDVKPLLMHPVMWQNTQTTDILVEADDSRLPQHIAEQVAYLLNQITGSSSPVIVDESICSFEVVRWVHRRLLDEEKEEFSYGYRVLSDAMDASLLCLARQAVRTGAPARGRHATQTVSTAQSLISEPSMERRSMPHTIAIICMLIVCIVGSAGAIYALLASKKPQKGNAIVETIELARAFLDANQHFTAETQERQRKQEEADRLIEALRRATEGIPGRSVMIGEASAIVDALYKWQRDTRIVGELYSDRDRLTKDVARERIETIAHPYPPPEKIARVRQIQSGFKNVLSRLIEEGPALLFATDIEKFHCDVRKDDLRIANWVEGIEGLIIAEPNAVASITHEINAADPNQYTADDASQINFRDPNLPNYVNPNAQDWRNPKAFVKIADTRINGLKNERSRIAGLLRNSSLQNAKNSPIPDHKKQAVIYETTLQNLQGSLEQNIRKTENLRCKAGAIAGIEARLQPKHLELIQFDKVLKEHKERSNTDCPAERIWVEHLQAIIFNFYQNVLEPQLPAYKTYMITDLHNSIAGSALHVSEVFEGLRQRVRNLERKDGSN